MNNLNVQINIVVHHHHFGVGGHGNGGDNENYIIEINENGANIDGAGAEIVDNGDNMLDANALGHGNENAANMINDNELGAGAEIVDNANLWAMLFAAGMNGQPDPIIQVVENDAIIGDINDSSSDDDIIEVVFPPNVEQHDAPGAIRGRGRRRRGAGGIGGGRVGGRGGLGRGNNPYRGVRGGLPWLAGHYGRGGGGGAHPAAATFAVNSSCCM